MNSLNLCLNIFKCLCILATAFMVGYWLFKFEKNSDVTLIEYKSIDEMPDFIYPELSICFLNPFVVSESLNVTNNYKFYTRYSEYLKGKIESKEYEALKYENASVNLANYLKELNIGWKPKKNPRNPKKQITKYRDLKNCPYATFKNNYNGFARGYDFNKCFGVEMNKDIGTDVTHFQIVFDGSLSEIIRQVGATIVLFNYPNQIVRPRGGAISIWQKENGTKAIMFPMSSVDVLIRRNKRNARCNDQWSSYDSQVLRKHIEKFGCRPPYISQHLEFPMCKSKEEIQRAYFDGWSLANNYSFVPCQEMPTMDFKSFVVKRGEHFKRYTITVYFPTKGKTITQLQEVDVHTLIGNIGGYIGLFLGNSFNFYIYN